MTEQSPSEKYPRGKIVRQPELNYRYSYSPGRAIDIPPRNDLFDWITKNYPTTDIKPTKKWYWPKHLSTHQMCIMSEFINVSNPDKSYCNKYAAWVVTDPDHPEYLADYRCDDHIKGLPDRLIIERINS